MERLTQRILPASVAIGAGVLVLAGYLVPLPFLAAVRDELVRWAVILAAFAWILGFFNLLRVHLEEMRRKGGLYSFVLVLSALLTLALTLAASLSASLRPVGDWWFQYVLAPLQATVFGLIAIALAVAAFRLVRNRREVGALVFLVSALIVLVGAIPLPSPLGEWLTPLREWWMGVLAAAGIRGFLIGVALGVLLVGVRVLVGVDRPYSEK